jgi:hypothetical protein
MRLETQFLPPVPSIMMGWTPLVPAGSCFPLAASLWVSAVSGFVSLTLPSLFWAPLGTKPLSRHHQVMPKTLTRNQDYLTLVAFPPRPFNRMLATLGPAPQRLLLEGRLSMGHLQSRVPAACPGHTCAYIMLAAILLQQ